MKFDEIVSKMFNIKKEDIKDDMSSKDIPDWDSMNYLLFIAELEKEFDFSFSMDEVISVQTLGELKNILKSKSKM